MLHKVEFNKELLRVSKKAIERFGAGVQAMKAIEEFAECIDAIAKASQAEVKSTRETTELFEALIDEAVDAYIVAHHLINITGVQACEARLQIKLWKLKKKIALGEKE